ncbi:hypothetical protein ACJ2_28430 [Pantoea sp. QMID2]|nr:hypothetical protein ACJ1_31850 [Pantoea sp. QMID1]GME43129.1 hypothetical protein ACJ3_32030 [Pantoea sp. QMID3]GME58021.1 hypothetical protein ACJ4_28360 [Pantoea sp. QMID4]GME59374.1 hypothetical protein ACJ2_28430 [Pantoea sp. QMID2]
MGRGHSAEDQTHPIEELSAFLQRLKGVEKGGRLAVQGDRLNVLTLLLNARLQCGQESCSSIWSKGGAW